MRVLLDTNVLCRLAQTAHPLHPVAEDCIAKLRNEGHELCIVPQVLYEYWVVVTRPVSDNGLGMQPAVVDMAIDICGSSYSRFSAMNVESSDVARTGAEARCKRQKRPRRATRRCHEASWPSALAYLQHRRFPTL
jgi:predicted nucleic acid-binding protein